MKKFYIVLTVILFLFIVPVSSFGRELRFGPRVGVNINNIHFNKDVFDRNNRAGFTGGLAFELAFPAGVYLDASVMYVRRTIDGTFYDKSITIKNNDLDYITVPINIKWNLGLPWVGHIVNPFIFSGPDFAFRVSKEGMSEVFKDRKVDLAWDFGVGVQLFQHLQISAYYGLGLTKWAYKHGISSLPENTTARNDNWTVTAAWLF